MFSPSFVLFVTDCVAVFVSCLTAFFLRFISGGNMPLPLYVKALPWLAVFPFFYAMLSLYPGIFMRRPEELKSLSIATCAGFLSLVFFSFVVQDGHNFSRLTLILAWLICLFAVPVSRYAARRYFCRFTWWAQPCVMFGNGERVVELCRALIQARRFGMRPAALVLDLDEPVPDIASTLGPADSVVVERIPLANPEAARAALDAIARRYAHPFAAVSFNSSCVDTRQAWLDIIGNCFQRIVFIPDMSIGGRVWVMAVSIGRLSGILVRQNLLDPRRMYLKRGIDLLLTAIGGIVAFPALLALAVAIRLDSHGPVFFKHRRIGRNGKHFNVYKFRTMAVDGDEILERHLAANPAARKEWEETRKLKDDPRVTNVGRFLRKTSLDELPQLFNVISGSMSLVGPRPIIDNEVERYGQAFNLYTRVRPGITGLWQTSGRNDLSYADRVWLDRHYVCNWSVWFDILILFRTIPEVLHCSGAY